MYDFCVHLKFHLSNSVCRKFRHTAPDGKGYDTAFYNLDVIISVGYRVKSQRGTQFRIWATQRLREYIVKGFTLNDDLLKNGGKGNYFEELLTRIRDIRSSEKIFWRKVLDIYATSIDYNAKSALSEAFFKTVQNKMLIYQTEKGEIKLEVRLENETVWLSQKLMAELFQTTPQANGQAYKITPPILSLSLCGPTKY